MEGAPARNVSIRTQIDDTMSDYDREKLQERLAKLEGEQENGQPRPRPSTSESG